MPRHILRSPGPPPALHARVPRSKNSKLARVVEALRGAYGRVAPPPATTAFALILWEKVAYLANDAKRTTAFRALEERIGLTPRAILAAKRSELEKVCELGGAVGFGERAKSMHESAALVMDEFGGNLDSALSLSLPDATRALMRFYGVGEPGAERIVLLMRAHKVLPLDSNGARTMVRLGYGADDSNYTKMYRSVANAARDELVQDFDWLIDAHVLLRHHGQQVCKTSSPRCETCVVRNECVYATTRKKQS